jgi:hypothetical protein
MSRCVAQRGLDTYRYCDAYIELNVDCTNLTAGLADRDAGFDFLWLR